MPMSPRNPRAYSEDRFGSDAWGDLDQWHDAAASDRTVERDQW